MYSEKVLKHFQDPKNAGEIEDASSVGEAGNMKCGDVMRIYLKVEDNIIKDIKFKTYGCIAAIASSDALCELVKGKTLEQAENLSSKDILEELGKMPAVKTHCSVLGIQALKKAIENYKKKKDS